MLKKGPSWSHLFLKASGLLSNLFNFPRSVLPGVAGGIDHSTDTPLLFAQIIEVSPIIKNDFDQRV